MSPLLDVQEPAGNGTASAMADRAFYCDRSTFENRASVALPLVDH